ncbi:MAG: MBL fold metallo-hydrolase [Deltaproteobacteria bacterium]|jgi:glyoxylase-like metal-dependent hydrolase (beta-lactamase superfamily II)|nr:MBL fold metallo-hydrolase [Deltaproteobacteria bacterium]
MKSYQVCFMLIAGLAFVMSLVLTSGLALAQSAGFYKTKIGNLDVTAISDATGQMGFDLLGGLEETQIKPEAVKAGSEGNSFPSFVNAFVVDLPSGKVLVDTGNGPAANLMKNLAAAGIAPEDIKVVLLTHYHGDHIRGLIDEAGKAAFPNATVYGSIAEDKYWLGSENRGEEAQKCLSPYESSERYKLFSPGSEVLPGVQVVELYGHTPGHVGFLFEGGDEDFLAWGDVVHIAYVQFKYPEATMRYDVDKSKGVEVRKRIFAQTAEKSLVVAGAHLPFPGIGRVTKSEGDSYDYKSID